ncbi:hypothetical protein EST38_g9429 [Candolleomyces aberdarensis]|uniref:Xylanolytic transcriptional activator regulatory domain-containing protein n=1 Tax=Candolleomyces aberdarensis TaxID=2316362 RepID=A0A4Q2D9X6_9AGAR|nr:hypothetical protein EST38_g9429 [Candolleomyces aberdarensis]
MNASGEVECTFSEGEATKAKKQPQQQYVEALQEKVERSEKLLELLCPDAKIREKLLSGEIEELPTEDNTSAPKHPITAITDAGAVSPIDLTVAGIRVHVNRRGQDADEFQDAEDLVDGKEFYVRLSLDAEELEESLLVQKRYLGKSSGWHLQRRIAEMKEMHRHNFESNSNVIVTHPDTETESGYGRRPAYWKIQPWEMPLFRSRPIQQSLEFPEPDLLNTLVEHYFKHINIELPLLHRPTFEQDIAQGLHKQNATFGAAVLLVCAMGSKYSDDPRVQLSDADLFPDGDRPDDANSETDEEMRRRRRPFLAAYSRGWKYFRQAWDYQESLSIFMPPTLHCLYFYCLAAQYLLQGTSSPQAAWLLVGIGIRLAQEVGAHRKRSSQGVSMDKDLLKAEELWKRACWVLITMDRLLTSATGRRSALDDEDFDLDLPIECDDEYWDNPVPELRFKQPEGKPSLITAFTLTIRFNQILAVSMRTIYLVKPRVSKELLHEWQDRVVSEIDSALNKWLDDIPPYLRWDTEHPSEDFFVQSAHLHSTYYYLQILVHRPFIPLPKKPSTASSPSLAICTNAARKLIQIGLTFIDKMKDVPSYMPVSANCAAVVLLLRIWESQKSGALTEQQYRKDMEGVENCLKIVKMAEKKSLSCGKLWDILSNLVVVNETYVRPNLENKNEKQDPARTRNSQESSKTTTVSPAPIYLPSPFTRPAVPLAADPDTGLPLAELYSAPDHPEVKNCTHKFDEAGADPRVRFFGNVNLGESLSPVEHAIQLPLSSIFSKYSHVVFATGCTLPKLHSELPPSANCVPALSLVHWYTQHPNAPPAPPPLDKLSHVSIIGNGNVSLDVARMLLTGVDVLGKYDVPQPVLDVLARSTVKHVSIIGRRGPLEAAFTMKELREMINLPEASMVPLDSHILQPPEGLALTRQQTRVLQLLSKGSKNTFGTTKKTWSLDFYRSPIGLQQNQLSIGHTMVDPKTQRAVPTGETSTIATDLVVTSLGFHGEPTASYYDPGLGHLRTLNNRIITPHGNTLKNVYASGWASTGARGVLASTMMNAYDVTETIVNDYLNPSSELVTEQVLNTEPSLDEIPEEVQKGIEEKNVVQYPDWKRIDAEEIRRGEVLGKERERMHWDGARALLHHQA